MFLLFWDILLIFCQFQEFKGSQTANPYYASQDRSTWTNAARKCTLWTPSVEYTTQLVNITQEYITEDLWIGYYLVQATFEFLGCWHTENLKVLLSHNNISLGRCYAVCGGTLYIGLSITGCFCTDEKSATRVELTTCDVKCAGRILPCGRHGYMALYKANSNDKDDDTARLDNEDNRPLNYSLHACLKRNGKITSQNGTDHCWEGVTKRKVIVKYNASYVALSSFNKQTQIQFCYVHKTAKGQVKLRFATNDLLKRALCARAHFTPTEDKTDGNTGVQIGVCVVAVILFIVLASVFVVLKRRRKLPNLCKNTVLTKESEYTEQDTTVSSKKHVHPSYGVTDKASELNLGKQGDNINDSQPYSVIANSDDPQPYSVIEGPIIESDPRVENQNKNNNGAYDYFILEASDQESGQNVENSSHNYFVLEKQTEEAKANEAVTTYDTTRPENSQKNINYGNVYNRINEAGDAVHDHVYNTTKKELQDYDKTYDTREKALNQITIDADRYSDETNEDTYNHIDGKPLDCYRSDNIYGIPLELKVSIKDANRQFDQMDQVELDTYSHLNSKATNNTKPDNVYGIQNDMKDECSPRRNSDGVYDVTRNINVPSVTDNTYSKIETQY